MAEDLKTWQHAVARCYINNPGGAYDPAPLPELDTPVACMPAVGDLIFDAASGRHPAERVYRVVERQFEPVAYRVALIVEEVEAPAVTPFV
ncbi:hypothetical protein [Paracoccus yeei]|uniref:hypothetical protein n=1 Tax=Paracoccus yeei TaxID=147645 RepID=UPI003BF907F9